MMSTQQSSVAQLSRGEWIEACGFHELMESQVLNEVYRRVKELQARVTGRDQDRPLVLLDLDSTLYEVGPRTFKILHEWLQTPGSRAFPTVHEALSRMQVHHVGYSVNDTLRTLGVELDREKSVNHAEIHGALEEIKKFWGARFFTNEYLPYDRPYEGAAEFARRLHELGAEIVYLTGRDEPGMGDGTRANLLRDGFPWEIERTHLLLKKASHLPDLDHKKDAAHYIRANGTLVASFENEPPNLIALYQLFPEAMHVFVDTVCSDHPATAGQGLYRIRHFGSSAS